MNPAAPPDKLRSDFVNLNGRYMRVFNFAAGPATLPLEVLEQAQSELIDWKRSGMSVMEVSHRSKAFVSVAERFSAGASSPREK